MDIWPRFVTDKSPHFPVNFTLTRIQWLWRRMIIPLLDYSSSLSNSIVELQVKLNSKYAGHASGVGSSPTVFNLIFLIIIHGL
jgi:hypothetical protein